MARDPWLLPPKPRKSDIRSEVIAADPEWAKTSQYITEYRFTSPDGGRQREFKAHYAKRGFYNSSDPDYS